MTKIVGDWTTEVLLESEEAKSICRVGQGPGCCAFLVCGATGFECIRMSRPELILERLKKGTMNAKGEGGWDGCVWQKELEMAGGR